MKTKKTLVVMLLALALLIPTKSFAINWFWESWWDSDEDDTSDEQYVEDDEEDPIDKRARELAESHGWTYDAEHMAFCYGDWIF